MRKLTCPECGATFFPPLRTTGKFSQNHAEYGFAEQIARWSDDGTSKREVLEEAMRRADIPYVVNRFGARVYRESSLSKEEASRVIDELKEIARFTGCKLVEVNE